MTKPSDCTCPKITTNGVIHTAALDVFCPEHGRQHSMICAGCQQRDMRIAELEAKLAAYESIVQTPQREHLSKGEKT